jgi:thiol-disulfide isomerase/thioredoxin
MTTIESMRRLAYAFVLLVLAGGPLSVSASAEDLGPPVGTVAPDIGMRLDQSGRPHRLTDLMDKNGLVLFFFRSADWCPYCQAQLIENRPAVTEVISKLDELGGRS